MSDDPLDLLGGMDDLDAALFGKKSEPRPKPSLGNLDSIFGDSRPSRSTLDSLFGEPLPKPSVAESRAPAATQAAATTRPRARGSDLFGTSSSQPDPGPSAPPPQPSVQPQPDAESVYRVQRLEKEVERLNREIEDLGRRKKRDEEDLEKEWRDRLSSKEKSWLEEKEELIKGYQKQLTRLTEQSETDQERLRENYSRQMEALQTTASRSRDLVDVVDKVDRLSEQIGAIVQSVGGSEEKMHSDLEMTLKLREGQLEMREHNLKTDLERFQTDKESVTLLNIKLKDLVQEQENDIQREKWKIREEWNRLGAERKVFKEDQKFVLDSIEKQKRTLEAAKESFLKEQHDLLIRVSNEKEGLDRELQQFHVKRTADVRRLKEEATQLQQRIQNVQLAEEHAESLRQHYETKYKQLCELEVSLMEECIELENLRNRTTASDAAGPAPTHQGLVMAINRVEKRSPFPSSFPLPDVPISEDIKDRSASVRAVLQKHADFLEKYSGQRVAAVAPRNATSEWAETG
ncbi:unnamed protein product, partial [Mesorhabditis spiculigera]